MVQDWKDMLAAIKGEASETLESPDNQENSEETVINILKPQHLHVIIDKKGRKGKTATIIEGFTLDDEDVAEVASELKRKIGTGGSSRGGEILLQGDWRSKVIELLRSKGFKVS